MWPDSLAVVCLDEIPTEGEWVGYGPVVYLRQGSARQSPGTQAPIIRFIMMVVQEFIANVHVYTLSKQSSSSSALVPKFLE